MARDSHNLNVGEWIVRARKTHWMQFMKRFVPLPLRRLAWEKAIAQDQYDVLGSRLFIPPEARNKSLLLDEYEPAVSECFRAILRKGMTFCDVGANIGVFSLFAARLVGPMGRVVAFEPIPENVQVLRANISRNGLGNVLVVEKAVAERQGRAEIHLSSLCGCHSLVSRPDASLGRSLSVETIRLDEMPELEQIDLLKIDAEGAEISVLRSLGSRRPRHLILEYNAARSHAAGYNGPQFLDTLRSLGYGEIENLDEPAQRLDSVEQNRCEAANLYARFNGSSL